MRKITAIVAIMAMAATVQAQDIVIDLGGITVPSAAVADVVEWLATQVKTTTQQVEMVDPDDGHIYYVTQTVVVSETPKQKIERIMRAAAIAKVREAVKSLRADRAAALAQAAADALPDPIDE